jgi:hypothetical protein
MYRIYRFHTVRCPSRDGIIGSRAEPLPMTYRSAALAQKLALRLEIEECGPYVSDEVWFEARLDGKPYHLNEACLWKAPDYGTDEIPF